MSASRELLRDVEPQQAATWLRANDWKLVERKDHWVAKWHKDAEDGERYEIDLPLDRTFGDYRRRMREVIRTLEVASGKSAAQLLEEVRASTVDILRLRLTGPGIEQGRVPVDLGTRLFGCTRDLLLAAACSARDPRSVYRSRKPAEAMDFLHRLKLAAPEDGSFVVTVHAPIPPELRFGAMAEVEESPFERRATMMLANATAAASKLAERAVLDGSAEPFLVGAPSGISANLCEALAGFVDGKDTTAVELRFAWATTRPVPEGTPSFVRVDSSLSPILGEAARLLRASVDIPDFEIVGVVLRLESDAPEQGGTVVIVGQVDGQQRRVRVPMGAHDYAVAIRAHGDGNLLRCEGDLVRSGRSFQLERVRHVEPVIEQD
ncbi:MAG: hypothetical protein AB7I19_12255 [Planctomycetota bacterium]